MYSSNRRAGEVTLGKIFTGAAGVSPAMSAKREQGLDTINHEELSPGHEAGEKPAVPVKSARRNQTRLFMTDALTFGRFNLICLHRG
jgi:hypothetical protein